MMQTNPQLELARRIIGETGSNLFLTGKAGTGKTTFLKNLRMHSPKRMIVVAPTGVAAINAGGVTLHSFFQIPFGPYLPGRKDLAKEVSRMRREKIKIIRTLDLLVIDEISMVRADLLDCIDDVLRRVRRSSLPFGGVQLLMIGDTQQLTPVVKDDEWQMLQEVYDTPYFFSSKALLKTRFSCVELKHIFRQDDEAFIELLNKIRDNRVDASTLMDLNRRCMPHFNPSDSEGYIRLTTHNSVAQNMNEAKLSALKSKSYAFDAKIEGVFPEYAYPTDAHLVLKKDAQVMFIKNDSSPEKRYFNGKIGVVKEIDEKGIVVEDRKTGDCITVDREIWENMRYELNKETKEIEEVVDGVFEQYPLKTAWAITIHKSQGLTFERAIIDAGSSFSHGQVYVALSRCKRLDGLVLSSPITLASIRHDSRVDLFNREAAAREPDEEGLKQLHREYYVQLAGEQFSFSSLLQPLFSMQRLLVESFAKLYPTTLALVDQALPQLKEAVESVAIRFVQQVRQLAFESENVDDDEKLVERTQKAARYFFEKCESIVPSLLEALVPIQTDNKDLAKHFNDLLNAIQSAYDEKMMTLRVCSTGFDPNRFLHVRNDSIISAKEVTKPKKSDLESVSKDIAYPELYEQLRLWRKEEAADKKVPNYVILSQMALVNITNILPKNEEELRRVKGVGKVTVERYGAEILSIVDDCVVQYEYRRESSLFEEVVKPKKRTSDPQEEKIPSYRVTLSLFQSGKDVPQIAEERGLGVSTIDNHLFQCVQNGLLSAEKLCPKSRLKEICKFVRKHPDQTLGELRKSCEEKYSYAELRLAQYINNDND